MLPHVLDFRLPTFVFATLFRLSVCFAADEPRSPQSADGERNDGLLKRIRDLGGKVYIQKASKGNNDGIQIVLQSDWTGKPDDFVIFQQLDIVQKLTVKGVPLTDDDIKRLRGLKKLDYVELFGTKVTDAGELWLKETYRGITVDRRGNAVLGIRGIKNDPSGGGVLVTSVVSMSAAEAAGIVSDDILIKIDGERVDSFDNLTAIIGKRSPGDKLRVELKRGNETINKEVKLGEWK